MKPQYRLYKIGGRTILVQAVDFSLFHEHLRSIGKEWEFVMKVDELANFPHMAIVEGEEIA